MARARSKPRPMTAARKETFLAELRKHGIVREAARVASPGSATGAVRTFYAERESDPDFREAWDSALQESSALLERECFRRGAEGYEEHRSSGGVTSVYRKYSDACLLAMLRARVPAYGRSTIEAKVETTAGDGDRAIADAVRQLAAQSVPTLAAEMAHLAEATIRGE